MVVFVAFVCLSIPSSVYPGVLEQSSSDVARLINTVGLFFKKATVLDRPLVYLKAKLEIPDKVATDLKRLDGVLKSSSDLLGVVSVIPEIETSAENLKKGIDTIERPVGSGKKKAETIANRVKPLKTAVAKFDSDVKIVKSSLRSFEGILHAYTPRFLNAQRCINNLPSGSVKTSLQTQLNQYATASDQKVVQLNSFLQDVNSRIDEVYHRLEVDLRPLFDKLEPIEVSTETLYTRLQGVQNPLRSVQSLLDQHFSVSFPYPNPTWTNLVRISHYSIHISMRTIIQGGKAIEDEIRRILSSALYDAAKVFGLKKLIDDLVRQAESSLKRVSAQLNLNFDVLIPGLPQLDSLLTKIETDLNFIQASLTIDTTAFKNMKQPVEAFVGQSVNILQSCEREFIKDR